MGKEGGASFEGAGELLSPRIRHARALFGGLPSRYDRMGALLSIGQDPRWRRFMVSRIGVPSGGRVLDVATGTGMVARELAARTGASVVGLDQSPEMLAGGIRETRVAGMGDRVRFVLARAERLPFPDGAFDALTFTYLLRYVDDPGATLAELARVLKPGGAMASLEFSEPRRQPWRWGWWLYTRGVMPVVGRAVSPSWHEVGRFLGPSISQFARRHPVAELVRLWARAGMAGVRWRPMSFGSATVMWGTRASDGG